MELNLTKPIAFIDLETTGLSIASDRIIEISIVLINPDGNSETKTERINPTIPISPQSEAIHGINIKDLKESPTFKELAPALAQFIGNADLAGYNSIKFDFPLLVEEFLRAEVDFDIKARKFIDVQNIFHKMEPRTLVAAYKFYCQKELIGAHGAEADAIATYEVLKSQLDMYKDVTYKDKKGKESIPVVNDMKALSEFSYHAKNADLVGQIIFNDDGEEVFNFGKNKGKTVESVFNKEPQYYDWMMKSQFPRSTKNVIMAIRLRGFNKASVNLK
ncbi:MAG: 3'-5' exonuclease [Bacteroidetes bacterium]|nr:MAG: 3'-5' exonuclease [Bacteroidota bacterium]